MSIGEPKFEQLPIEPEQKDELGKASSINPRNLAKWGLYDITPVEQEFLRERHIKKVNARKLGIKFDATQEEVEAAKIKRNKFQDEKTRLLGIKELGLNENATIEEVLDAREEKKRVALVKELGLAPDASLDAIKVEKLRIKGIKQFGLKGDATLHDIELAREQASLDIWRSKMGKNLNLLPDTSWNEIKRINRIVNQQDNKRPLTHKEVQELLRREPWKYR